MTTSLVFFEVTGYFDAVTDPSVAGNTNSPLVQPVSALITFTPRILRGQQFFISDYLFTAAYSAAQNVFLIGNPTGGTWTLSYGGYTTGALQWDITTTDLQTALRGLTSIGGSNVTVTAGSGPASYTVEFGGALANTTIPAMEGDGDLLVNLEGEGFCEVTVVTTAQGSPQITGSTAISLPPLTARIWSGVLSTIDFADTPGFQLASNIGALGLSELIYDVAFSNVTFNGASQYLAPFAFAAPEDDTGVVLTDPGLTLLPYRPPSDVAWTPPGADSMPMSLSPNWRQRALNRSA